MRGRIRSFDVGDRLGELVLEDGRALRFGASAFGADAEGLHPGLAVEVLEVGPPIAGAALRATRVARVSSPPSPPEAWSEAAPGLRLQLFTNAEMEPGMIPRGPVGEELSLAVVWSWGSGFLAVRRDHLGAWSVDAEHVLERAAENLLASRTAGARLQDSGWVFERADGFAAACVALSEDFAGLPGLPVLFLPHRRCAIVVGSDATDALAVASVLAEGALLGSPGAPQVRMIGDPIAVPANPDALVGRPLIRVGATLTRFETSPSHPVAEAFARLDEVSRAVAANRHADALSPPGGEFLVAPIFRGHAEAPAACFTVWPEQIRAWLPKAPFVLFARTEPSPSERLVPWERVREALGGHMRPVGTTPERWEVSGLPPPELLASLEG